MLNAWFHMLLSQGHPETSLIFVGSQLTLVFGARALADGPVGGAGSQEVGIFWVAASELSFE